MAINVLKELIKGIVPAMFPFGFVIPLLIIVALLPFAVLRDDPEALSDPTLWLLVSIPFIVILPIIPMLSRTNVMEIIKTANIEKRTEKLKQLGASEFIKKTNAKLIDSSPRGNKLYATSTVISGRTIKFLIYKDKSTDREYISFVRDHFVNADDAMASKFSLGSIEYQKLKLENEA